jgi:hypothetical protein
MVTLSDHANISSGLFQPLSTFSEPYEFTLYSRFHFTNAGSIETFNVILNLLN